MKKIKKLVIGGIESKVVTLILISMLLVAAVFWVSMLTESRLLSKLSEETSERQITAMTGTTAAVIDQVIVDNMDRITGTEAVMTDEVFQDMAIRVQMVSDYAGKLLDDPGSAPRVPWNRPDPRHDGELFVKILLADGLEEAEMEDELGLIANLGEMMLSLCTAYGTENIWFSTPDGVTLMADTAAGNWVRDDGSYVTYDAVNRYWYRQAEEAGKLIFTDVEYDHRTGVLCVTCAMPVYGEDRQLLGVAGEDLYLDELQQTVMESSQNGGLLVVVNQMGHVIMSPDEDGIFKVMNSSDAEDLRDSDNKELGALVRDAMQGKTDVRQVPLPDGDYYMIGAPMETVGWTLVAAYRAAEAEQPVRKLQADYQEIQEEAAIAYRSKSAEGKALLRFIVFMLLFAMVAVALILSKQIVKPLNTITKRISELSETNLEFKMEDVYRTGDEVEELARSFAKVSHQTVEYLETVKRVTAEKERIGAELHLATQIQGAMLPHIVPAFPDRKDFDIIGSMDPAKEVGGDFYDYFLIDDDHLGMLIADVSGKGVPAALFMMASKIILQSVAMLGGSPAEILTKTNKAICSNNEAEMFVTVWVGILKLSTGRLTCASAGHEYPVFKSPGGKFELFKDRHGFVLGSLERAKYKEYEIILEPGSKLFVYTDGVPEATNADMELFGTERMVNALNSDPEAAPMDILGNVRKAVDSFVQDAEQFDDLTMLCMEYKGPKAGRGEEK